MTRRLDALLDALLAGAAFAMATGAATAHHSIGMFDQEHPIELVGKVQDFRFTSPHTYILLEVQGKDARPVIWNLEGSSPNSLTWSGWSSRTLKPGDELRVTIDPLRSGSPGGVWYPSKTRYKDGSPIVATH
jgi:uncharacterized protein DUF6152